jgi:hypothetical protein
VQAPLIIHDPHPKLVFPQAPQLFQLLRDELQGLQRAVLYLLVLLLSPLRLLTTLARHRRSDLGLFAVVADDQLADEDQAIQAGVGAFVVIFEGGCASCAIVMAVNLLCRLAVLREAATSPGLFLRA